MSSDSDSSLELHDIQWEENNPVFDYNDPLSVSPQLSAVIEDNVSLLKALLESGKSVNINDNLGNTPLHVAVLKQKRKIFDYLLIRDDVRVDAANFQGFTPLTLAIVHCEDYYACTLIETGADVNVQNNAGISPLHCAVNKINVAQMLVDKGANINAQDGDGETPLCTACDKASYDFIHFLLFCGADVMVPNHCNFLPFTVSMFCCSNDIQEILFDFTYDESSEVSLQTLVVAMQKQLPYFHKLVDMCQVVYEQKDLRYLCDNLILIEPEIFKVFVEKCECVVQDLFVVYHSLTVIFNNQEFFYLLLESNLRDDLISNIETSVTSYINFGTMSEESLIKSLCCMLSYGCGITTNDVNIIYGVYGFGELFKILLHMKMVDYLSFDTYMSLGQVIMPRLIYDISLRLNVIDKISPTELTLSCFEDLIKIFAHKNLVEYCKFHKIAKNLPNMPSLLQLSRECVRDNLIKQYSIKNSMQFHTLLNRLPTYDDLKAILRYETPIYYY